MEYKTIQEIAIDAFKKGSDNFGEVPTGKINELTYSKLLKSYQISIELNKGTAGIGLYPEGNKLSVISGHEVFKVDITPEIQKELDEAILTYI